MPLLIICRWFWDRMRGNGVSSEGRYHYWDVPLRTSRALSLFKDVPLRTRRALSLFKDVPLRTRRALSPFKDVPLRTRRALSLFKDVPLRTRRALSLFKDAPCIENRRAQSPYRLCTAIAPFWFSTQHLWILIQRPSDSATDDVLIQLPKLDRC